MQRNNDAKASMGCMELKITESGHHLSIKVKPQVHIFIHRVAMKNKHLIKNQSGSLKTILVIARIG